MILALALAALNQDKQNRPCQVFPTQENSPTETVGYGAMLRLTTRQDNDGSEISDNAEEVIVAPSSSPAENCYSPMDAVLGSTSRGSFVARAFSFPFITKSFVERTAAVVGAVKNNGPQPSSTLLFPGEHQ